MSNILHNIYLQEVWAGEGEGKFGVIRQIKWYHSTELFTLQYICLTFLRTEAICRVSDRRARAPFQYIAIAFPRAQPRSDHQNRPFFLIFRVYKLNGFFFEVVSPRAQWMYGWWEFAMKYDKSTRVKAFWRRREADSACASQVQCASQSTSTGLTPNN